MNNFFCQQRAGYVLVTVIICLGFVTFLTLMAYHHSMMEGQSYQRLEKQLIQQTEQNLQKPTKLDHSFTKTEQKQLKITVK